MGSPGPLGALVACGTDHNAMRPKAAACRFILNARETVRILEGGILDARLLRPWTADQLLVPLGAVTNDPPHFVIASAHG